MDLELPPEMPNGGDDDDEEDDDDDRDGLDDSYDLTGLSDKLHSIPTEAFHEAPREVKIDRDGGDGEICLDEMGRPKGFDGDAVVGAKSSPKSPKWSPKSTPALPHSNGLISAKAEENGVEVGLEEPSREVHDFDQASVVQSEAEVSHMPKEAEIPPTVPEDMNEHEEVKEREEWTQPPSDDSFQEERSDEEVDVTAESVGCDLTSVLQSEVSHVPKETGEEVPQTVPEDKKQHEEVEQREDSFDDNSQEEVQEKRSDGEFTSPAEPIIQESAGCSGDNDDDDFGDFDSAFAASNVIAASETPAGFPAPPIPGQSGNWSASFVSEGPSRAKGDDEEDDFGDFTESSVVTATSGEAVADPDPSLESLQQILDSLRPKISFVIRNLDHLAFVSADDDDGCHVSPLDLEADFAPAADDEEEREAAAEEDGSCKGDAVWNRVHRVDRSPGLSFGWDKSVANEKLLSKLKMDRNNIVFDSSFQSRRVGMASGGGAVPAFALGLSTTGLLEPTRVSEEHQVDPGKDPKGGETSAAAASAAVPPAQFDWKDSGLTNPLTEEDLERQLDELGIPNTAADSSSTGGATDNGDGISNGSSGSGGGGEGAAAADTVTKGSSDWLPPKSSSPSNSTMSSRSRATLGAFPLLDFMRSAALHMPKTPTTPQRAPSASSSPSPVPGPNLLA